MFASRRNFSYRSATLVVGVATLTAASPLAYASTPTPTSSTATAMLRAEAPTFAAAGTGANDCGTTRFQACATTTDHFDITDNSGAVRGSFDFTLTGTMTTSADTGDITVSATYNVTNQKGDTLTDTFWASGCNGPCASKDTTHQAVTFTNGKHTVNLTYTAEQVAVGQVATVTPQFSYTMKTKYASYEASGALPGNSTPRCDRALAGNTNKVGCVFPEIMATWNVGNEFPAYTSHVRRAIASGLPSVLTHADTATNQKNRNRSCGDNIRPTPAGFHCDEYPMASTNEGAASGGTARTFDGCQMDALPKNVTGPTGWSQCYIPEGENTGAGKNLNDFYRTQRVLVGDKFKVNA